MFRAEYVPLVEQEQLAHEYLSLKQMIELVTEITKIFMERSLFYLENATPEQVHMSWYLIMLKKEIKEFVSTHPFCTLTELYSRAKRREIEL